MEEKDEKVQGTEEMRAGGADARQEGNTAGNDAPAETEASAAAAEESSDAEGTSEENAGKHAEEAGSTAERKLRQELLEMTDKYTRLYAEFDNFRKRSDREKSQMFELGARDVIEKLLPVVDNFERALAAVPAETEDAFAKGVQGIYRQIQKFFADLDVAVIEAEGQKFDPAKHNAVMTDTESDAEEDTVTQDLQKGYTFRGTVVRHSMVKVKK